jgi:Ca2+-binding EF-hand superfamily protein
VRLALVALAILALASCSDDDKPMRAGPLYSPNGEPLSGGPLGEPSCADALGSWFARVDTDHDGTIDEGEFLADANRQFAAMDLDKSGALTPSELAQYRAPYVRPVRRPDYQNDAGRGPPPQEDVEDPVMVADTALRNRVTRDDFLAYARRNFASLDRDHDGTLDRAEVLAACKR